MEFKDAVKQLRKELELTQSELASALHITALTVGRWERGVNRPNNAAVSLLLGYARVQGASAACLSALKESSATTSNRGIKIGAAERTPFEQLTDDAFLPIYVCDLDTYEVLYINKEAERLFSVEPNDGQKRVCYECFMHRSKPCEHCVKNRLLEDRYIASDTFEIGDGSKYQLRTKQMNWNGQRTHVCYVIETESWAGVQD